ncbi:MAG: zf-TFIIB domain-containing protein [candidate division WOR-3 bacterium]
MPERKLMCPKYCGVSLQKVRVGRVVVDRCPRCQGVWFDLRGEELLEVLRIGPDGAPPAIQDSWVAGGGEIREDAPRHYNCPYCGLELRSYSYLGGDTFKIDGCPIGHGVWLDDGELTAAYRALSAVAPDVLKGPEGKPNLFGRLLEFLLKGSQG